MIPIFILTCDRLEILKQSMRSYGRYIDSPFEVAIIDFGSTYRPMIEFLSQLKGIGIEVYEMDRIDHPAGLGDANNCIQDYFGTHPISNYIVTDPDVALDNVRGDILGVYGHFLEIINDIAVVGPMLRIDDIPDYYPLKKELISGKKGLHKRLHSKKVELSTYKGMIIEYIRAPIDTTFGMYRAGTQWKRLNSGIRILAPYGARHLDWYIDPDALTPDQEYYIEHAAQTVAHWSNWNGEVETVRDGGTIKDN